MDRKETPLEAVLGHVGPNAFDEDKTRANTVVKPNREVPLVQRVRANATNPREESLDLSRQAFNTKMAPGGSKLNRR